MSHMAPVNYNKTYLEVEVVMKFSVFCISNILCKCKKAIVDKEVKKDKKPQS